jgi:hypothetical protein
MEIIIPIATDLDFIRVDASGGERGPLIKPAGYRSRR